MPSFSWPGAVRNAGQQWLKVRSRAGWQVDPALERNEKETFAGKPFPPLCLLQRDVSSRKSPSTQHLSPSELHPAALSRSIVSHSAQASHSFAHCFVCLWAISLLGMAGLNWSSGDISAAHARSGTSQPSSYTSQRCMGQWLSSSNSDFNKAQVYYSPAERSQLLWHFWGHRA